MFGSHERGRRVNSLISNNSRLIRFYGLMPIEVKQICNSVFTSCSYVISHRAGGGNAWIVDCGDVEPLVKALKGKQPICVLLTHAHFDHIYGLNNLLRLFPDTLVYTNENGRDALLNEKRNLSYYHETPFVFEHPQQIRLVNDGDEIELIENLNAKVISTPGHNPSCLTYIVGDAIFTGDSYIPGTKVITNLPKGNKKQAQESLDKMMQLLIKGFTVYPGHLIEESILL